ncbi:hypothetical protein NFHSH190041_02850 [Shewanella sp. NFH-SH190041]|uniref:PssD/Cps14F family polysaccharide biosynthesis glycosyltransferase n=1 Tax=Shewanella sp. NFH-SH190041 TaxID=2950245 RepID=UPI0021C405DF|nr:PssD/Cps14F family polysaccharide biosynthesis glycosyltransferase [Shewanella sp. NFH-SH190041]BDM62833.1 hypothetical protein NFHSH190041_02850 [Shewanella sp. NFH-SH190041]
MKQQVILLSYGQGGHATQMHRLVNILINDLNKYKIVTISDEKNNPQYSYKHFITKEVRKKNSHLQIFTNLGPLFIFYKLLKINSSFNVKAVITTGPGISLLTSIIFKIKGVKIIHVATWSRFNTKSITDKYMYYIADKFYIQNIELLKIYPKAIFAGRL